VSVAAAAANITCVWCPIFNASTTEFVINGTCMDLTDVCNTSSSNNCVPPVVAIIPPCPDNCSFQGACAHISCDSNGAGSASAPVDPTYSQNQNYTQICSDQNTKSGNLTLCLCADTYTGINCGIHTATSNIQYYVAGGIAGGAIAGIVIGLIAFCAAAGGGSYAAYRRLGEDDDVKINTSPLYEPNNRGGDNPLYGNDADDG